MWQPNSPDLNSVDWELMHERVYKTPVRDTSDLKQRLNGHNGQAYHKTSPTNLLVNGESSYVHA